MGIRKGEISLFPRIPSAGFLPGTEIFVCVWRSYFLVTRTRADKKFWRGFPIKIFGLKV